MVIKNGKIVECTDSELFGKYLDDEWDLVMDYNEYKRKCKALGTTIIEETDENN